MNLPDSFLSKVQKGDCWLWSGAKDKTGYGALKIDGVKMNTHRYAYEMLHGAIPADMGVKQTCGNRLCVKPSHLKLVSRGEWSHKEKWHGHKAPKPKPREPQRRAAAPENQTNKHPLCPAGHAMRGDLCITCRLQEIVRRE